MAAKPVVWSKERQRDLDKLLFRTLMLALGIAYVISVVDRAIITLVGVTKFVDLNLSMLTAAHYLGAVLFFFSYVLPNFRMHGLMHRIGARRSITAMAISWCAVSFGTFFLHEEALFYGMRLLLGIVEAGLFGSIFVYLGDCFGRMGYRYAVSFFLFGACTANIVSDPLWASLVGSEWALNFIGWSWISVLQGVPCVALMYFLWLKAPAFQGADALHAHEQDKSGPNSMMSISSLEMITGSVKQEKHSRTGQKRGGNVPQYGHFVTHTP